MDIVEKKDIPRVDLKGRSIRSAVGVESFSHSEKMTVGFALYNELYGKMEPHRHAEEVIYIVDAQKGYIRYGSDQSILDKDVHLKPGMLLHIMENEWHMFDFDEGGFIEVIYIYGQVDNIRPEQK